MNPAARTSIICAVWHGDPNRWDLIRGHAANLARQTVPVEPIYIFDGGDLPPDGFAARSVSVKESLTIYQAWNVALSLTATPLVMNLNLDDRLAPDAVALLENQLLQGAMFAGGDWNICYSQEETDLVKPCYPAEQLPFVKDWPPAPGTRARLGSGTSGGMIGPACAWRIEAHIGQSTVSVAPRGRNTHSFRGRRRVVVPHNEPLSRTASARPRHHWQLPQPPGRSG